jgi:FdhE protein
MKEALLQLARLKKQRPALQGLADFFSDVLPRLFEGESHDRPPAITPDKARAKLASGVPVLRGESVALDEDAVRRRWLRIAAAIERHQDANPGKALTNVVHHNKWNLQEIVTTILAGSSEALRTRAEMLGLDPELAGTVIRLSLVPSLANVHGQLLPLLQGAPRAEGEGENVNHSLPPVLHETPGWERGYCPTCGSWPLLGEFRGLEQNRFLRCGFCTASWKVPRLLCPFCENRDHRSLGYLSLEGDETKYRINTCESCRGYVKMLSTLMPLSAPELLAADVATMHLDLAAAQRGYAVVAPGEND